MMRVTNHFATQQAIAAFTTARDRMNASLEQVTTGRRLQHASDDPVATRSVMQNDSEQRALAQLQRTLDATSARLTAEEGALDALGSLLTRAKELAIGQGSDTATAATRKGAAAEVNQLLAQAVHLANTTYDRGYLFGGATPGVVPYTIDMSGAVFAFVTTTPAPDTALQVDVGASQLMPTAHEGTTVFGDDTTGVLAALRALAAALDGGVGADVIAAIPAIDSSIHGVQVLTAENGAWANRIQMIAGTARARHDQLTADTTVLRDVDIETAMTELVGRQTALQAAMAATARTFGLSLTDYLR
jgi:flagellar hook-associated protein 3 FlgL